MAPSSDKSLSDMLARLRDVPDPLALLAGLFAHSPVAFQLYRADGRCVLVNAAFVELFGAAPPPEYNVLDDDIAKAQGVLELIHRAFKGETVYLPPIWYDPRELKQVKVEVGKRSSVSATFFPLFDAQQRVSHVAIAFRDHTEETLARERADRGRNEAEQLAAENQRLLAASQFSEQQFRALVENLPELAWSAQPNGDIDFYNRRWFEYTGTTYEEMKGWGWEKVHDPKILPFVKKEWQSSLRTGEPFEMEFPLRGADGIFRWFLTRVVPLRDAEGRITRWFGSNVNIDEARKQAAALKEAVAIRDTFLSVASHELNTPLTPLALRLQLLAKEAQDQPDSEFVLRVRAHADSARRQVKRLSSLVKDLLDVSRIAAGRFKIELDDVDFAVLTREVLSRFEEAAARAGSRFSASVPQRLEGRTDPLRYEQVLTNLVDNAIKYGRGSEIRVELCADDAAVRLRVADKGIGIDAASQGRIFERFERAVSERNYGGLGLGLYITRTVVEALGGKATVESELGVGSTFTVLLPRAPTRQ